MEQTNNKNICCNTFQNEHMIKTTQIVMIYFKQNSFENKKDMKVCLLIRNSKKS